MKDSVITIEIKPEIEVKKIDLMMKKMLNALDQEEILLITNAYLSRTVMEASDKEC